MSLDDSIPIVKCPVTQPMILDGFKYLTDCHADLWGATEKALNAKVALKNAEFACILNGLEGKNEATRLAEVAEKTVVERGEWESAEA